MKTSFKYFTLDEFVCSETGNNEIKEEFVLRLDNLRHLIGLPLVITSGYRDPKHSAEVSKPNGGGTHTEGIAADIACHSGALRYEIIKHALLLGFTGIGIAKSFVHLDTRDTTPVVWTY